VLSKHPKGKDVSDTDEFSVNLDFKDDHVKVRINQIQLKETVEENRSTTDRVFVDRQNHVQLVIVRTLKARKTIKHQELVMEVVTQLKNRFKVETTEIKKAIGSLSELCLHYGGAADFWQSNAIIWSAGRRKTPSEPFAFRSSRLSFCSNYLA
jgi:hypothetical protein